MSNKLILITTLAEYQTSFWIDIGKEIIKSGFQVAFVSFDDRSTEMLLKNNFKTYYLKPNNFESNCEDKVFDKALDDLGLSNFAFWSSHERITFGLNDKQLQIKFLECKKLVDRSFSDLYRKYGDEIVLVQELGGFLSNIVSFFAARKLGIANWFIEPSFFRGKLFFLKNSFSAIKINTKSQIRTSKDLLRYLRLARQNKSIVIPQKDKHQYTSPITKILNTKNLIRFFTKTIDKYVLGKRYQFGYIGRHVFTHLKMLKNSYFLQSVYTKDQSLNNIIYYPLHVPCDMALTIRSPEYLDQLSLIEFILRNIPDRYKLAVKEHPAMIGAVDAQRLIALKKQYKNLIILNPAINNFDVLELADLVISVNSKAGGEAVILKKPVIVLGDAFYKNSPYIFSIDRLSKLKHGLNEALKSKKVDKNFNKIANYFERVWRTSHSGELYISDVKNISIFTKSLTETVLK